MNRKTGSLKSLILREYWLVRKKALQNILISVIAGVFCLLVQLSAKIGNLAVLAEKTGADFIMIYVYQATLMIQFLGFGAFTSADTSPRKDRYLPWKRFLRSSPVSAERLMLAKYIVYFILYIIGIVLGLIFTALSGSISGNGITSADIGFILLFGAMAALLLNCITVFMSLSLLQSEDAVMICSTLTAMAVIIPVILKCKDLLGDIRGPEDIEKLYDVASLAVPYTAVFTAAVFIAGYFLSCAVYKRREK